MKTTLLSLGLVTVGAQGVDYDYRGNGSNWGYISDDCHSNVPNQSPIDFISPKEVIKNKSYAIVSSEEDKILKEYNNVKDVEVRWTKSTS